MISVGEREEYRVSNRLRRWQQTARMLGQAISQKSGDRGRKRAGRALQRDEDNTDRWRTSRQSSWQRLVASLAKPEKHHRLSSQRTRCWAS
jgi:hypothetical protein